MHLHLGFKLSSLVPRGNLWLDLGWGQTYSLVLLVEDSVVVLQEVETQDNHVLRGYQDFEDNPPAFLKHKLVQTNLILSIVDHEPNFLFEKLVELSICLVIGSCAVENLQAVDCSGVTRHPVELSHQGFVDVL